jgi:hypothetical protein
MKASMIEFQNKQVHKWEKKMFYEKKSILISFVHDH